MNRIDLKFIRLLRFHRDPSKDDKKIRYTNKNYYEKFVTAVSAYMPIYKQYNYSVNKI